MSSLLSPSIVTPTRVLAWLLLFALTVHAVRQVRKPDRWIGRLFLWIMNLSHSSLTDWGLSHVPIEKNFKILDIGCGGGRTIQKLSALTTAGTVHGIDYADGSVAASRARNAGLIAAGRVEIQQASVSKLPYPEGQFDLITAIETQYYWPDLIGDMQEILRVLKPGGTLLIVAETYKKGATNWLQGPVMKFLGSSSLGVEEQQEIFSQAGYTETQVFEEKAKGWICVVGKKPRRL